MAFVLDWRKKLGYREDPFITEPRKRVHEFFVDREREREALNLFIIKRTRYGILQGAKGAGKTTLLRWTMEELEHQGMKGEILFFDDPATLASQTKFADVLLERTLSILERKVLKPQAKLGPAEREALLLKRLRKRRTLILIDDANGLSQESLAFLKTVFDSCPNLQIVFSLKRVLKAHEEFAEDGLRIALDYFSEDALVALVVARMALVGAVGTFPFKKADLKTLAVASKGSPAKLLGLCRERAIELSLKVEGPPKPVPVQSSSTTQFSKPHSTVPQPPVQQTGQTGSAVAASQKSVPVKGSKGIRFEEEPKKKWFSIRFAREEDLKAEQERAAEREVRDKPSDGALLDASLLDEVVENAGKNAAVRDGQKKEDGKKPDGSDVDEVIQSLVDELQGQKTKQKRR